MPSQVGLLKKYKEFRVKHPLLAITLLFLIIFFELALVTKLLGAAPGESVFDVFFNLLKIAAGVLIPVVGIVMLQICVHEGGHALVAKLVSWDIKQVNIGPITWQLRPNGFVRLLNEPKLMPASGYVASCPKSGKYKTSHFAFIIAAGFLANLVVTFLLFSLIPPQADKNPTNIIWIMFLASAAITLLGPMLDIQYLFKILIRRENWAPRLELSRHVFDWSNWTRPRDFDIESILGIAEKEGQLVGVRDSSKLMHAYYLWDHGSPEEALKLLNELEDAQSIKAVQTEKAFLEEMIPNVARTTPLGTINAYSHPRHKAFQKYCSGDYKGCINRAEKAIQRYRNYLPAHRPSADFQYELLELLVQKAKMQLNAPPVQPITAYTNLK